MTIDIKKYNEEIEAFRASVHRSISDSFKPKKPMVNQTDADHHPPTPLKRVANTTKHHTSAPLPDNAGLISPTISKSVEKMLDVLNSFVLTERFCDQLGNVEEWFKYMTENERIIVIMTLLRNIRFDGREFVHTLLENRSFLIWCKDDPYDKAAKNETKDLDISKLLGNMRMSDLKIDNATMLSSYKKDYRELSICPDHPKQMDDKVSYFMTSMNIKPVGTPLNAQDNEFSMFMDMDRAKVSPVAQTPTPGLQRSNSEHEDLLLLKFNVNEWLKKQRLHKYTLSFAGLPWYKMINMTDADLDSAGVVTIGARRKFLKLFECIKIGILTGSNPTQSQLDSRPHIN